MLKNCEEAIAYIHSRKRFPGKKDLKPMQELLRRLDNPEKQLQYIHVVGTNGKGSVTAMVAAILQNAGYRTGMNISPYIVDFRERLQINGVFISPGRLTELTNRVRTVIQQMDAEGNWEIAEFDAVTAIALLWFCEEKCDIVCLEAGLGGRLDATNTIPAPLVSCITRIGLDHTEILGDAVEKIAQEKCGIIKPGTVVISYPEQTKAVADVISCACKKCGVPLIVPEPDDVKLLACNMLQNHIDYGGYQAVLPMKGRWQGMHMAMAVETALQLAEKGWDISDEAIIAGLEQAKQPARMEILGLQPIVLLDGSHNIDGIDGLASVIEKSGLPKMHAVIGMLRDKECAKMLERLSECFDKVWTVTPDSPRAMTAEQLAVLSADLFDQITPAQSVPQAIRLASQGLGGTKGLCICGSLYLAGEARKFLLADK